MYKMDEKDKRIREFRETTKYSPALIGQRVGLDGTDVRRRLHKMGLVADKSRRYTSLEAIKIALENGMKYREITREYGISGGAVAFHAKKWGIRRRFPVEIDDELLIARYVNDKYSINDVYKECGWNRCAIKKRLEVLGLLRSSAETKRAKMEKRLRDCGRKCPIDGNGYQMMRVPPGVTTGRHLHNGMCYIHTLEMEKKLGRYLEVGEVVHHIDMDRENNLPSNLHFCQTKSEHAKIHGTIERVCRILFKRGVVGFNGKGYFIKDRALQKYVEEESLAGASDPVGTLKSLSTQ